MAADLLIPDVADRRIAVLGLGRSGMATAVALRGSGADVIAWDDTERARALAAEAGFALGDPSDEPFNRVDMLVMSPGIPHRFPQPHPAAAKALAAGTPIVCDIELMARAVGDTAMVGISGTNGKSTTTALIGHVLKTAGRPHAVGGNIGTAALSLPKLPDDGVYVLELSSFQLELVDSTRFTVAVLLNITPDHLDRHGGMDGYIAAKHRLFRNMTSSDTAVICVDTAPAAEIAAELAAADGGPRVLTISTADPMGRAAFLRDGRIWDRIDGAEAEPVADLAEAKALPGRHNAENALAAYVACRCLGLPRAAIVRGLLTFPGLAHRQELVATADGVRFVNDSKATNADAASRALASYGRIYWIAGGRAKDDGLAGTEAALGNVVHAFLIGEAADAFAAELAGRVPTTVSGTIDRAVPAAFAMARGDADAVVLLSPACASYDQFKDFEARGEAFRAAVMALADASTANGASGSVAR